MSTQIYSPTGVLVEEWDDATRTYTDHRLGHTRGYTEAENTAADLRIAESQRETVLIQLHSDTTTDLSKIHDAIAALQVLLGDAATVGSIRSVIGTPGEPAGTTTLRAWRAQNASAMTSVSGQRALVDLIIALAQRTIDDAAATRRVARQTLRLAKLAVGDVSSADVGVE